MTRRERGEGEGELQLGSYRGRARKMKCSAAAGASFCEVRLRAPLSLPVLCLVWAPRSLAVA